jgi:hypothetical protein
MFHILLPIPLNQEKMDGDDDDDGGGDDDDASDDGLRVVVEL